MEKVESCLGFLLFGLELLPSAPNKEALFYREIANSSRWNGHSRAGNFTITFRTSKKTKQIMVFSSRMFCNSSNPRLVDILFFELSLLGFPLRFLKRVF